MTRRLLIAALAVAITAPGCATLGALPAAMGGTRTYLSALSVCRTPDTIGEASAWFLAPLFYVPPLVILDVPMSLALDVSLLPVTLVAELFRSRAPRGDHPAPRPRTPPPATASRPPAIARPQPRPQPAGDVRVDSVIESREYPAGGALMSGGRVSAAPTQPLVVAALGLDGATVAWVESGRTGVVRDEGPRLARHAEQATITAAAVSRDALVAGDDRGGLHLRVAPGSGAGLTTPDRTPVTSVALADGPTAFGGHASGRIDVWPWRGASSSFEAHGGPVACLDATGPSELVSACEREVVRWDLAAGPAPHESWHVGAAVRALAARGAGPSGLVVVGLGDGSVQCLSPRGRAGVLRASGGGGAIVAIAATADGEVVAWATAEGDVVVFDLEARRPIAPPARLRAPPLALALRSGFTRAGGDASAVLPDGRVVPIQVR